MCVSSPKVVTTQAPAAVTPQDPAITDARERERRRLAAARMGNTILNGGTSTNQTMPPKTLLGA